MAAVRQRANATSAAAALDPQRRTAVALNGLTDRERDVAALVALGLADKTIAHELDISFHTVRSHLKRIFTKIGVDGRMGLAAEVWAADRTELHGED